jgi:hypothetical protein
VIAAVRSGVSAVALCALADKSVAFGAVAAARPGESVLEERKDRCEATGPFAPPKHRLTETPKHRLAETPAEV